MDDFIAFEILTEPIPKARPRVYRGHAFTPKRTADYEKEVLKAWKTQSGKKIENSPMSVTIHFSFSIPKSVSKKRREQMVGKPVTKRPDLDNLVKAILDALNGEAFDDDSFVSRLYCSKEYAVEPRVTVCIVKISEVNNG